MRLARLTARLLRSAQFYRKSLTGNLIYIIKISRAQAIKRHLPRKDKKTWERQLESSENAKELNQP